MPTTQDVLLKDRVPDGTGSVQAADTAASHNARRHQAVSALFAARTCGRLARRLAVGGDRSIEGAAAVIRRVRLLAAGVGCAVAVLIALVPAVALAAAPAVSGSAGSLAIIAGRNRSVVAGPATATPIGADSVAVDSSGNRYIADPKNDVVEKVTPSGTLSIIAGVVGHQGAPTAGPATSSDLNSPQGVAVDSSGNVYIADTGTQSAASGNVVVKVTPSGTLSIIAGRVDQYGGPTPGPATSSDLYYPEGVAVDSSGNVYITDTGSSYGAPYSSVVVKVTPSGTLSIIAGIVGQSGAPTPGPATSSDLGSPQGVAVDSSGNVYIADDGNVGNPVVEKVSPSGTLSIFAGVVGQSGAPTAGPATSSDLGTPYGVAVDGSGNVYIADTQNGVVEKVASSGALSIFAGVVGQSGAPTAGPATSSDLDGPSGVAVDSSGNVYIADYNNSVVEKVTSSGTLSIIAGIAWGGAPTPGPATSSGLSPSGVAVDGSGNVYIADAGNDVVEKVTPSGTLSIFAGVVGHSGPPTAGPATSSDLNSPSGVAVDSSGNVYIADAGNDVVEKVTPSGTLSIFAGRVGQSGAPTAGPATSSDLSPFGVAVDSSGNVYIADYQNDVVEKVSPSGTLSIFAGVVGQDGPPTPGPATSSDLGSQYGVAVDSSGNVYIADYQNHVVEKVTSSGTLSIFAGVIGHSGPPTPGPATSSDLDNPEGVAVDSSGNVYIADTGSYFYGAYSNVVEKVTPSGTLSIVAGRVDQYGPPTPGPATSSDLGINDGGGVAVDSSGNVYIADYDNGDVEEVFGVGSSSPVDPTSTSVACSPNSVTTGNASTCTATVTDTASSGATTPTGSVSFTASPASGSFGSSGSCTLAATGTTGVASCQLSFTPSAAGSYSITGSYGGDSTHQTSSGQLTPLTVSPSTTTVHPTRTNVSCAPGTVTAGSASTCTATVTDTASSGATTPTGSVSFTASPASGSFGSSGSCTLAATGTTGVASCQLSFTPSAAGSYTITGSYGGDSTHQTSSGQENPLTVFGPSSPGNASVGHVTVSGTSASVPVSCSGGSACTITLTLSAVETLRHGKVTAVAASAKTVRKTVVVGSKKVTVAAGKSETVKLSLNGTGKRLLAKHKPLRTKLTVRASGKTVASSTIAFKTKKKKR